MKKNFNNRGNNSDRRKSSSDRDQKGRSNNSSRGRSFRDKDGDQHEERGERKSYGRKPYRSDEGDSGEGSKRYSSDRRSFRDKDGDQREERGERKSYGRKPYRSDEGDSGEGRKRYSSDRRSFRDKDGDQREARGERKSYGRKPYRSDEGDSGEGRKRYSSDRSSSYRDFKKRSGDGRKKYETNKRTFSDNEGDHNEERTASRFSKRDPKNLRRDRKKFPGDRKSKSSSSRGRNTDMQATPKEEIRLNKYLSNAGIGSRREADELISAGMVSVNGTIITELGSKIKPGDTVKYNNELVRSEKKVYVLLNKPKDYITTTDDEKDRKTVMMLVENATQERIYPVGRLDRSTTGLLLFTNDGELATRLMHPSSRIQKIYQVELNKQLSKKHLEEIQEGIVLEDGVVQVDDIAYDASGSKKMIGIKIHEGRNRVVRRIFEHLEYEVVKLDRVIYAGLTKKELARGRWRHLTELEVNSLYMLAGFNKKKRISG